MTFYLNDHIARAVHTAGRGDILPRQIAEEIFPIVPEELYVGYVKDWLTQAVRAYLSKERIEGAAAMERPAPEPEFWVDDERDVNLTPPARARVVSHKSQRSQAIRDLVAAWLDERFHVADGTMRRRADMTAADLRWSASERHGQAAALATEAAKLEALAVALEQNGVQTLGELSSETLEGLISR